MKKAIELIVEERNKQITKCGIDIEQDVHYNDKNQLLDAAVVLVRAQDNESGLYHPPAYWGEASFNKLLDKPRKERLVIAAALIAAEIDRMQFIEEQIKPHVPGK